MRHAAELGLATVFDSTIAKRNGFLYAIYGTVENQATLYVGQTRGRTGALGRLAQHLSDGNNNTYLQRLSNVYYYEEVPLEKVDLAAIKFTSKEIFQIDSQEYRIAVEHLVQLRLLNWLYAHNLKIRIVSQTRSNSYSKLQDIQEEADRMSGLLESWILESHQESGKMD